MESWIISRVMRLCAGLLLTVVISGATAQPMQEVDLLIPFPASPSDSSAA